MTAGRIALLVGMLAAGSLAVLVSSHTGKARPVAVPRVLVGQTDHFPDDHVEYRTRTSLCPSSLMAPDALEFERVLSGD